jgi:hypothetical protein
MKRLLLAVMLIFTALLFLVACGRESAPAVEPTSPPSTAVVAYRMAVVRTSTPTPSPILPTEVATSTPTSSPVLPTEVRPTATWVPLITPSPTPGEKVPARSDVPRIGVAEARTMADAGEAVLVDVRGDASYEQEHIASAISIPAGDISRRYAELPADKLVIFYCA